MIDSLICVCFYFALSRKFVFTLLCQESQNAIHFISLLSIPSDSISLYGLVVFFLFYLSFSFNEVWMCFYLFNLEEVKPAA